MTLSHERPERRSEAWKRRTSALAPWLKNHLMFSKAAAEMELPDELRVYAEPQDDRPNPTARLESESRFSSSGDLWIRIKSQRGALTLGFLLMALGTLLSVSEPWIFGLAIDRVLRVGASNAQGELRNWALLYAVIIFSRMASVSAQLLIFERVGQKVMLDLRVELFSHLLRLPVSVFDRTSVGKLVTRVSQDIGAMNDMFSAGIVSMILNLLTLLGIVVWLFILSPKLALISVLMLMVMLAITRKFTVLLTAAYRNTRSKLSALNAFLAENLMGMRVLQLFGRESVQLSRYEKLNSLFTFAQMGTTRLFSVFHPSITLMQGLAMSFVLVVGVLEVRAGLLPLGILVSVFAYVQALFQPMRELAEKWNIFLSGMASADRVFSILKWPLERQAPLLTDAAAESPGKGSSFEIEFQDVWFAYSDENWVLRGLSFKIPQGSSLGLVGHTGAGKSTIMQLLLRFYEPQKGRILLGGRDLLHFPLDELRAYFGVVQQESFLFSGSVLENIRITRKDRVEKSEKEIEDFWMGLGMTQEQWSLPVEERGSNRSAGEKQMIAFARAWALSPQIWILDEATANIDSEGEKRMEILFQRATQNSTRIVIAHRLATVRSMDQILVLNQGKRVELGSHAQLMQEKGLYARWVKYQSLSEELIKENQ